MKKTLLAAAFAAAAAIAVPVAAGLAQDTNAQNATSPLTPDDSGQGMRAMPEVGGGPMMRHHMWMHRMMMGGNPQEHCIDRLAWRAARLAYIETKLDLTAAQRPLWDKVQSAAQTEAQTERQICGALKAAASTTVIDRLDHMQQFLAARLDGLKAAQPAVAALYQALTPAQRAILDHPFHRS